MLEIFSHCEALRPFTLAALNRWGRDKLLDWPTKLGHIDQKTDSTTLGYVVEIASRIALQGTGSFWVVLHIRVYNVSTT